MDLKSDISIALKSYENLRDSIITILSMDPIELWDIRRELERHPSADLRRLGIELINTLFLLFEDLNYGEAILNENFKAFLVSLTSPVVSLIKGEPVSIDTFSIAAEPLGAWAYLKAASESRKFNLLSTGVKIINLLDEILGKLYNYNSTKRHNLTKNLLLILRQMVKNDIQRATAVITLLGAITLIFLLKKVKVNINKR